MRIFNLFILSIILCLSLGFASCSNEQEDEFDDVASKAKVRSVSYIPEWWNGKDQLEAPYPYQTSYWDRPFSSNTVDTCDYYFSIVYSWGTSYALQYYKRLQLQYRFAKNRYEDRYTLEKSPDSEWHNIGEEYPKERYPGGIIQKHMYNYELDIDANHFPKARLNMRYRLLHNDYPGTWPTDTIYNKILSTKWTIIWDGNGVVNNYGYASLDSLLFHVNFPMDSRDYNYSVYVDNEQVINKVGGLYAYKKAKKQGKFEISALMHFLIGGVAYNKSGKIEGTYDENTRDIYANFTPEHFLY